MDRQLAICRVRIAAAVLFGLLAVSFALLWARSYFVFDRLMTASPYRYELYNYDALVFVSFRGSVTAVVIDNWDRLAVPFWDRGPAMDDHWHQFDSVWQESRWWGFGWMHRGDYLNMPTGAPGYHDTALVGRSYGGSASGLLVPHWFLVAVAGLACASPWAMGRLAVRYSLRTMLVGTTLVAVVLGICVALAR